MNKDRSAMSLGRVITVFVFMAVLFAAGSALAEESVKKRVAVLPWNVNAAGSMDFLSGAVSEMLTSRLGSVEGVTVVRSDILKSAVSGYAAKSDSSVIASGIGGKLKLDYVLYGSITLLGESVSLDAKLLDVKTADVSTHFATGRGLDSVVAMAERLSKEVSYSIFPSLKPVPVEAPKSAALPAPPVVAVVPPVAAAEGVVSAVSAAGAVQGGEKFWKGPFMDELYKGMVSVDLDKDGVKEFLLLRDSSVTVALKRDNRFEVVKELKSMGEVLFVAIDAIDTDNDGTAEVYVSGVRENNAESFSIEYDGSEYKWALKRLPRLFRAVDLSGRRVLVGQGFREAGGFYGDLRIYESEGIGLVDRGRFGLDLPEDVDIYRFALMGDKEGRPLLAALDPRGRIVIYSNGGDSGWQREWKSSDYFGGTLNYIDVVDEEQETRLSIVPVESRFFYMDIDGNGSKELVIKTGTPGGLGRYSAVPRSYADGTVLAMAWDGQFLNELWRTKKVSGYISDFFVEKQEGKGVVLWMLIAEGGGAMFGKPKSYVLSYQLAL